MPFYRPVINATGVVLHTGLGRSPLPPEAAARLAEYAARPVRVELELESGQRGGRDRGCAELLCEIVGAEAATVVNNNAGATLLILAALARGREVIVSRGELVEIGGSYRVPMIMEESGAILREVGTTNRTHVHDYARAIDEETGMLLKVHTSNYRIDGFTKEVTIPELAELGREYDLPVVHDLGSGCLLDLEKRGVHGEPFVRNSLDDGADLICFSGDKLLGGPQCGIIMGSKELVDRCRKHPLFRALRPCRLTYMSLESVLRIYREGEDAALSRVPALSRLLLSEEELRARADRLAAGLRKLDGLDVEVRADHSMAGSGSLPARDLPTWVVTLRSARPAHELSELLRTGDPPIVARVKDEAIHFDGRTLADDEIDTIIARVTEIVHEAS